MLTAETRSEPWDATHGRVWIIEKNDSLNRHDSDIMPTVDRIGRAVWRSSFEVRFKLLIHSDGDRAPVTAAVPVPVSHIAEIHPLRAAACVGLRTLPGGTAGACQGNAPIFTPRARPDIPGDIILFAALLRLQRRPNRLVVKKLLKRSSKVAVSPGVRTVNMNV
jgi:hypothetical protein